MQYILIMAYLLYKFFLHIRMNYNCFDVLVVFIRRKLTAEKIFSSFYLLKIAHVNKLFVFECRLCHCTFERKSCFFEHS